MRFNLILLISILCLNYFSSLAQESWKLEKEKNGVTIYSGSGGESNFKSFRAHTILEASIEAFIAVLLDIENMTAWGYNLEYADLLEKSGDTIQIYYAEASAPFPFKNRDGIYHNQFRWLPDSSKLVVEITLLPDYLKEEDDMIRVKGKGYWHVMVLAEGKLEVTFQMEIDPGGSIPAWLANIFVEDTPLYTLEKLKEVIRKEKYQHREFEFIN